MVYNKKSLFAYFLFMILCFSLSSCKNKEFKEHNFFAMDTFCYVQADFVNSEELKEAENKVLHIEQLMSKTLPQSEIYELNNNGKTHLSDDTLNVLKKSLEIASVTNGAFCPTLAALTDLWNITGQSPKVPSDKDIQKALESCDYNDITLENNTAFSSGAKIDLGAIAKGYAAQKAIETLKNGGAQNAMVSLGGNVAVSGSSKANEEKGIKGWNVGIRNPKNTNEILGYVVISDAVCAVSGDYERYFEQDGVRYHHIFDVLSGYPAQSGLSSVAVISKDGAIADALTTAFFVMGKQKALEFYKSGEYSFEAIFIDNENNVSTTDNIEFINVK